MLGEQLRKYNFMYLQSALLETRSSILKTMYRNVICDTGLYMVNI